MELVQGGDVRVQHDKVVCLDANNSAAASEVTENWTYVRNGKDDPKAAHYANVCPSENVTEGIRFCIERLIREVFVDAIGFRRAMLSGGDDDPSRSDTESGYRKQTVERDISAVENRTLLCITRQQRSMDRIQLTYLAYGQEAKNLYAGSDPADNREYPLRE